MKHFKPILWLIGMVFCSLGPTTAQNQGQPDSVFVHAWESFTYPPDLYESPPRFAGDLIVGGAGGINNTDNHGEGGWLSGWILKASDVVQADLAAVNLDTARIQHQDAVMFPGSYCLRINTTATEGPMRQFPLIESGELWTSFVYQDNGPDSMRFSGMAFQFDTGQIDSIYVGKIGGATTIGIGNLPVNAGAQLTDIPFQGPNQIMVRFVLDPEPGMNDDVFLWVNPTETDRLDTYLAGGENIADITGIGVIHIRRSTTTGQAYYDDIMITTHSSLPPVGARRVDLGFDPSSPLRQNPDIVLHDVISTDQFLDTVSGPGYGHNESNDHFLVVQGFYYVNETGDSRVARGVPIDRMSGLMGFAIASFNDSFSDSDSISGGKNALRFHPVHGTKIPVRLDIEPGHFGQCRILTSGDGNAVLNAEFHYEDSSIQKAVFNSPDWFDDWVDDGQGGILPTGVSQVHNHMNWINELLLIQASNPKTGENPSLDDAAFFSSSVLLDSTKTLTRLVLGPSEGDGIVNVYDLLLEVESDVTPVIHWMLY